ncbi:hypothetical protein BYT27DRAFT_7119084 [Phlegmacium glaucopus]|nr:hypothetical protein BYT27DRAFT_7119084 [Phlegmacium glaucopus]
MHDSNNGVIDISECEWLCFLYPEGTSPDVEDDLAGLFQGYLLPRVFQQIFTGPRPALDPGAAKGGCSCKAHLHNLMEVLPHTIAYTYVIVSFDTCLFCSMLTLAPDPYCLMRVFYQNIVKMFEEDLDDPWVKETLAWWNEYIPSPVVYIFLFIYYFTSRQVPGLPHAAAGTGRKTKMSKSNIIG